MDLRTMTEPTDAEILHSPSTNLNQQPTERGDEADDVAPAPLAEIRSSTQAENLTSGVRDSSKSWGLVKNRVRAMGMARNIVKGNVPLENKMGYYTWDELKSGKEEFKIAVCLQFAIGAGLKSGSTSRNQTDRTTTFDGGLGFDGATIPKFTLLEHRPGTFLAIREHFDMDTLVFSASLTLHNIKHKPNLRVVNKHHASGKSSSWFFFSSDMRFALKTCTKADTKTLLRILESYTDHVQENTLLPRFFGLYSLNLEGSESLTFVVMNNVFAGYLDIHSRYDLKGSTAGRRASQAERQKNHPVYKDLDILAHMNAIPLGCQALEILKRDTKWLSQVRVMDYSLLLGFHIKSRDGVPDDQKALATSTENKGHPGVVYVEDKDSVVYMGIVDILTEYKVKKMAETFFSGTLLCRNVSCQPPSRYARRMDCFFDRYCVDEQRTLFGLPKKD